MKNLWAGKVAVVTGASRGIGRAIVRMLAGQGAHVAFNYLQSADQAKTLVAEAEALGVRCLADQVDICDFEAVKNWIADVKSQLGGLDMLINNAGIVRDKSLMMMLEEDWLDVIRTNENGMFNAARACIVTFLKQRCGNIVNISSVSGLVGMPGQTNYSASKGAMNAFTRSLAKETAAYGVRVNAVAPGFIETEMVSAIDEQRQNRLRTEIPLGRFGRVEEVAAVVRFLLSEDSGYMTGQVIQMDGGLAIR